jgi:hypothetical protein
MHTGTITSNSNKRKMALMYLVRKHGYILEPMAKSTYTGSTIPTPKTNVAQANITQGAAENIAKLIYKKNIRSRTKVYKH